MKIKDIISKLEEFAPLNLAEEWDNVGLMLGDAESECGGIMLALDLTTDVIEQAEKEGCNLIVTHHPFIFRPIKRIVFSEAKGREIRRLIKSDINVYSMHTNLDKTEGGINAALCELLGANEFESDGVGAIFKIAPTTLGEFAKRVANTLDDKSVKIVGNPNKAVKSVYVVSGSGGSEYRRAYECADVLLTGDLKHHDYIDAIEDGFALVEYSHFSSEIIMQNILESTLKNLGVKIIKAKQSRPFRLLEEI
ncbi:MAG: Nif3-like dinuclear metal center hexameric protein [[Eubacterium] siraeum]|nr:Nif3-like dinuclear metal center hexameric protein [[Eubacterium] siraeum]